MVHVADLPAPVDQYVIRHGGVVIGRADFVWLEAMLVVEIDGYEYHREYGPFRDDRRRDRAMRLAGWLVLRFTSADLTEQPDVVIAQVTEALRQRGMDV
jgi:very-short-patch-repair endonuclease